MGITAAFTGDNVVSFLQAEGLLKVTLFGASLLLVLRCFLRCAAERAASFVLLIACLSTSNLLQLLRINWINNFLPAISTFFLVACVAAITNGAVGLTAFILCASVLLRFHLAAAPIVLGASAVIALHRIHQWQTSGEPFTHRIQQGLGNLKGSVAARAMLATIALLWFFPLAYELIFAANITALFSRHVNGKSLRTTGIDSAVSVF
ncbi:MAG: hypothetical protein EBZ48_00800 [Proteobacteria bacterium]|nr:hypothetical protein [Pseudomonadota bacterium]